jgi:hypothetical protein
MEVKTFVAENALLVRRWGGGEPVFSLFNFDKNCKTIPLTLPGAAWEQLMDSSDLRWAGAGSSAEPGLDARGRDLVVSMKAHSFVLYRSVREAR